MTKKADKILVAYAEKFETHVSYFATHAEMFKEEGKLDKEYNWVIGNTINDLKEDFLGLVRGMYRFDMLSEKDFDELYDKANEVHMEVLDKMLDIYIEARY